MSGTQKPSELLAGDLDAARQRLRAIAEVACRALDAGLLNLASVQIATYLDVTAGRQIFTTRIFEEVKAEQRARRVN